MHPRTQSRELIFSVRSLAPALVPRDLGFIPFTSYMTLNLSFLLPVPHVHKEVTSNRHVQPRF